MPQHDSQEYRFAAIEKRLDKLDEVHEIVTRLDERFDKIDAIYNNRTTALEKTSETHGKDLDDLKTFKWRAMGTIGLVLVLVSIFGSAIGNAVVRKFIAPLPAAQNPNQVGYLNETNYSGYSQAKDFNGRGNHPFIQPIVKPQK